MLVSMVRAKEDSNKERSLKQFVSLPWSPSRQIDNKIWNFTKPMVSLQYSADANEGEVDTIRFRQ